MKYKNGNASIEIQTDGTRTIEFDETLNLEYPLNIDIRVQSICPLGYNPKTNKAVCSFCHESATTDGNECDYATLLNKLEGLPKGIELAIGCNILTDSFVMFLTECHNMGYICNVTINQLSLKNNNIAPLLGKYINGLGISYRNAIKIPQKFIDYENMVVHVIAGIDDVNDIIKLKNQGVKKILVLGEKDFGFNSGNVDLNSAKHKEWYRKLRSLFDIFEVVSFDNLALEQLNVKRFVPDSLWDTLYQGEYSFYINAVTGMYSRSSRSHDTTQWDELSLQQYFKTLDLTKI